MSKISVFNVYRNGERYRKEIDHGASDKVTEPHGSLAEFASKVEAKETEARDRVILREKGKPDFVGTLEEIEAETLKRENARRK